MLAHCFTSPLPIGPIPIAEIMGALQIESIRRRAFHDRYA